MCGLVRYYVLVVIDIESRRVHIAGISNQPHQAWMKQIVRNLTDAVDGFLLGKRYLIHDREPLFCEAFRTMVRDAGIKPLKLPRRSPNLNAHCERFVRTLKEECLSRLILFGEQHLRRTVAEFMIHYHQERYHQGLGSQLIMPADDNGTCPVRCRERLGGLLKYYHREAA